MRFCAAGSRASAARSMSAVLARASEQTTLSLIFFATSLTARKSPSEAIAKPASMTSTPICSSSSAIRSFSLTVIEAPGDCSPSRRVVSKMMMRSSVTTSGRTLACSADMAWFLPWLNASLVNPSPEHARRCGCGSGADKSKLRRKDGKTRGCGADRAAADVEGLISGLHHRCERIALPLSTNPPAAGGSCRKTIETRACAICKGGSVCVRKFRAARGAQSAARCPTMHPLRRSVPAHAGTRASAWSSCAATSRSSTVAPPFVPDQGLAGAASAAPCALSPARWSQGWSLIARSIAPAGQARSTCRYWAPSPRHSRRPRQLLATTHARLRNQRRSVKSSPGARSPAASSRRGACPTMPSRARTARQGRREYIPVFGS